MKLVIAIALFGAGTLVFNRALREESGEWVRDLSDRLMMLLLRSTSGFAADVPSGILDEERERRLRWQRP